MFLLLKLQSIKLQSIKLQLIKLQSQNIIIYV
jgi:hypothetical protein